MLEVQNLSVRFGAGKNVVDDVTFTVNAGECVALVGESGSGKSVTALSILQLLNYPYAFHPTGRILWKGQDVIGANPYFLRDLRGNRISMIFQEPMSSLNPLHSIGKQISEVITGHQTISKKDAIQKAIELLDLVGFKRAEKRLNDLPHLLSGGERQRVMIAMALANNPELLIADEPTTALDVTVQAQILELLQRLQKQLNLAILFISHDLDVVRQIANRVYVMKESKIIESGSAEQIFVRPSHPYTQLLLKAKPNGKPLKPQNDVLLRAENITVPYVIKKTILGKPLETFYAVAGADLEIKKGQTVGLVGESGSGKTTLANAILRLVPSQGKIEFMGQDLRNLNRLEMRTLRTELQVVFQDPFASLSPRMTVEQIVGEGLEIHFPKMPPEERKSKIIDALKDVGLTPEMSERYPHAFSGGQRQRIAIARALVLKPKLIVLDEPTSALDVSVQAQIIDLLKKIQKQYGVAYLFISHDMRVVKAFADTIYVMKDGKIVESGNNQAIFEEPMQAYTKDLLTAAFDFKTCREEK